MLTAYHEIKQSELHWALRYGLKCTARGDKGSRGSIVDTDQLLDQCCPAALQAVNVSRNNNLYCYLEDGGQVVDIRDGASRDWWDVIQSPNHRLLKVAIDPARSYVGDLDLYDDILETLGHGDWADAQLLAAVYWDRLLPLSTYNHSYGLRRPELLVTYDIPSWCIQPI